MKMTLTLIISGFLNFSFMSQSPNYLLYQFHEDLAPTVRGRFH